MSIENQITKSHIWKSQQKRKRRKSKEKNEWSNKREPKLQGNEYDDFYSSTLWDVENAIFKHDSIVIILPSPSLFSFMIFIFNFIDQRYDVNLKCVIEKKQQVW